MSYADQKFYARPQVPAAFGTNVGTATATASGHVVTLTAAALLAQFDRRTIVNAVKVMVVTAPGAALTTSKLVFKNGTNTFAVATIGTNTAGAAVDASMTAANATFSADSAPTVDFVGTSTASANTAAGLYSIYFEQQEQYSA